MLFINGDGTVRDELKIGDTLNGDEVVSITSAKLNAKVRSGSER